MQYEGNIIRPPSEANSILLQITVGCSHNKCTFCGTYRGQRFRIKSDEIIDEDINFAGKYCQELKRVFLCDGDALIIPQKRLVTILKKIKSKLSWITRIGIYANVKSLKSKSLEDLKELKELSLGIVYMGLESGDDETLKHVMKKANSQDMIEHGQKVKEAGIKLSITVLLGISGPDRSENHAKETGRVLSEMNPDYIGALSLMLIPGTPLYKDWEEGNFILPDAKELLMELRTMIDHTNLSKGLFFANHASNYLPIKARLPKDKEVTLQLIDQALAGNVPLKPEWLRAL